MVNFDDLRLLTTASLMAIACVGTPALGQDAGATGSLHASQEDSVIVVTAQKRSESLQEVPLAITAVSGDDLTESGVNDLAGVTARVPNLNLSEQLGAARIALRGIGLDNLSAGAEGSIAFHIDGVFISRSIAALSSFYDLQQLEVLRGPQGTLYGRNATGGSINLNTRKPSQETDAHVNLTYGNYNRITAEGAVGGALIDDLVSARMAFQIQHREGYGTNLFTGTDIDDVKSQAVRGSLRFTPSDSVTIDITGDYYQREDNSGGYHYFGAAGFDATGAPITPFGLAFGGQVAPDVRDINNEIDPRNFVEFWGVSGQAAIDLTDEVSLTSLTAYRETKYDARADLDATTAQVAPLTQFEDAEQFSHELQLAGDGDRFDWLLGLYYFHENDAGAITIPFDNAIIFGGFPGNFVQGYYAGGVLKTDAYAIFGQASYAVTDQLTLTLGGRYSDEKKTNVDRLGFDVVTPFDPATQVPPAFPERDASFSSFTPRVAVDYQATPDLLLYASWSKGFKSGTYNLGTVQQPLRPEKVDAFEAGLKSELAQGDIRFNLAGFYYDYSDLQVSKVANDGRGLVLENAATAEIYGLEAEILASITPEFEIAINGSWLHARFKEFVTLDPSRPAGDGTTFLDTAGNIVPAGTPGAAPAFNLAGNSLSQSPDFTFFVAPQYTLATEAGDFTLRGELAWKDRVFFTAFNTNEVSQAAHAKLNVFLNWESVDGHLNGSIFVKNITDKTTASTKYVSSALVGFPVNGYLEEPRTYGIRIGYKY